MDPNLYAAWRASSPALMALNETCDPPPERLLQHIWHHQRLVRESLSLCDGRRLRVLHPGFWNREAGPDFRDAVIQFGDDPPGSGDVEVDLFPGGWKSHAHQGNPAYARVILHVVWQAAAGAQNPVATVAIKHALDAPVEELADWAASGELGLPPALVGRCRAPLAELAPGVVGELLLQAARERLRHKAEVLRARARRAGWDQALWEGLFAALGYKHNAWPMRRVAELLPRLEALGPVAHDAAQHWQARLLGVAGWLPPVSIGNAGRPERGLWDLWWRERDAAADVILPRGLWRLGGLRPANHPQRRLVLAAHWIAWGNLPRRIEAWFHGARNGDDPGLALLRVLQPAPDPVWSRRWTFEAGDSTTTCALIGAPRVADLAVNVILPWFWARAGAGKRPAGCAEVEKVYLRWPAGEDNAVLRRARLRLFGGTGCRGRLAAEQQGLLQIARDFCDHSDALCGGCPLPDLVAPLCGR